MHMDESELSRSPNTTVPKHDEKQQPCSLTQSHEPQTSGDPSQSDRLEQSCEAKQEDGEDSTMDHSNGEDSTMDHSNAETNVDTTETR